MIKTKIVGILNITPDSFSDGGRFFSGDNLDVSKAVERALEMVEDGASIIDVGAESTHPDSRRVSAEEEIRVLQPVISELKTKGVKISVDTYKPEVIARALAWGVDMINDVTALKDPKSREILASAAAGQAGSDLPIVLMYSRNKDAHAEKSEWDHERIITEIKSFFYDKIEQCQAAGIQPQRLILDPGMGFFLGANPEPSLMVLKHLAEFKEFGLPLYVSTSRKSFIGTVTGAEVGERGAGTLATEIWAAIQGVDYIRTHDVQALSDSIKILSAINKI